jgi:NADH dehydrogenase FAD-containing subunit
MMQEYYQAKARSMDNEKRVVVCEDLYSGSSFALPYDYLVIAVGCKTNTFNTPGVESKEGSNVFFLKHLHHARSIRNRIIECFERASNPTLSPEQVDALLSFVVVGGGPTSCEFATELKSLLDDDMPAWYPTLASRAKVSLVEAGHHILGSFESKLVQYYETEMRAKGIQLHLDTSITGIVPSPLTSTDAACFADGRTIPFGCLVWSAGLSPVTFVSKSTSLPKHPRSQRITVDAYLRVPGTGGRVFALGDCALVDGLPLPPTASVAEQQAAYLGECFNLSYGPRVRAAATTSDNSAATASNAADGSEPAPPHHVVPFGMPFPALRFLDKLICSASREFQYVERGSMASFGSKSCVTDLSKAQLGNPKITYTGAAACITWRGA